MEAAAVLLPESAVKAAEPTTKKRFSLGESLINFFTTNTEKILKKKVTLPFQRAGMEDTFADSLHFLFGAGDEDIEVVEDNFVAEVRRLLMRLRLLRLMLTRGT